MNIKGYLNYLFISVCIIAVSGCSSTDQSVGSYTSTAVFDKSLFNKISIESAEYRGILRNPVIVMPGFLGSELKNIDTGKSIWGTFSDNDALEGFTNDQLIELSHPMCYGLPLSQIEGNVKPVKLLDHITVTILGLKFEHNAYNNMIYILNWMGYIHKEKGKFEDEKVESLFTFYYDWRRDNVENAIKLHNFIQEKRKYLQQQYEIYYGVKNYDVQFDILAHSMGGLIARYYLKYGNQDIPEGDSLPTPDWRGSRHVDKVVIIGTPNAGYLDSCVELINGLKVDPDLPAFPPAVVGSFPAYYQMMPLMYTKSVVFKDDDTGEPIDMFNPDVWIKMKWGLADPKQDKILKMLLPNARSSDVRRKIALDHLKKCLERAKKFTECLKVDRKPPNDVELYLFLGDAVETSRRAAVDKSTGCIKITEYDAGDGKVLISSAIMDEREGQEWKPYRITPIKWKSVTFLKAAHMGIIQSYSFADNLAYYLLNWPPVNEKKSN